MATLEKVIIKIYPMGEQYEPYVISFEHVLPNLTARELQERIFKLLKEEFIAEGAENIKKDK